VQIFKIFHKNKTALYLGLSGNTPNKLTQQCKYW